MIQSLDRIPDRGGHSRPGSARRYFTSPGHLTRTRGETMADQVKTIKIKLDLSMDTRDLVVRLRGAADAIEQLDQELGAAQTDVARHACDISPGETYDVSFRCIVRDTGIGGASFVVPGSDKLLFLDVSVIEASTWSHVRSGIDAEGIADVVR